MYLNFSKALVQKRGQVSDGGDWQNFCQMGDPQSPQEKNPVEQCQNVNSFMRMNIYFLLLKLCENDQFYNSFI